MKKKDFVRPTRDQVAEELRRERYKRRYRSAVTSTVYTLITVAAAAVLVATLLLPVLRIYGTSMTPTLDNGQIVVSVKTGELEPGDVVAFYYNNKILIKRVMGDHRETSVDSRSTSVGCVAQEQIVGRIFFRVWPLNEFGFVD